MQSETFIEFDDPISGTVLDVSPHGLRLLCGGTFVVGQAFVTELKTDRLQGIFPGIIRNVVPWVDGNSVLGCELFEPIPNEILESLAREKVINRRLDDRVDWNQSAKMSCELQPGEVDVEIHNCSASGLKISSKTPIPDDVRVRVRIEVADGEPAIIDARTSWQTEHEDSCWMGLTFTTHDVPTIITRAVANHCSNSNFERPVDHMSSVRPSVLIAATIVVCGAAILQSGLWG